MDYVRTKVVESSLVDYHIDLAYNQNRGILWTYNKHTRSYYVKYCE